jgi:transcriptional regulator with XRE-family HTH domain
MLLHKIRNSGYLLTRVEKYDNTYIYTSYTELRMKFDIFPSLGAQLRQARKNRKMTQPDLALRLGRSQARISELERDLLNNRLGRDRLTLLVEVLDALDLVPVLVPRSAVSAMSIPKPDGPVTRLASKGTVFDEVFVDLSDDEDR